MTLLQKRDHIGVLKLRKFRVMRSHGEKRVRGAQANDLVDPLSQLLERAFGCDRDREDDFRGSGPSDSEKRGAHTLPVAIPSSTTMTVLPASGTGGRSPR